MTNYNDGNWHGWNGGECPVHPKTEVEAVTFSNHGASGFRQASFTEAGRLFWGSDVPYPIIAFRATKEHREPREWWADPETGQLCKSSYGRFTVKVREVLDE